jgi:hypothetical protein
MEGLSQNDGSGSICIFLFPPSRCIDHFDRDQENSALAGLSCAPNRSCTDRGHHAYFAEQLSFRLYAVRHKHATRTTADGKRSGLPRQQRSGLCAIIFARTTASALLTKRNSFTTPRFRPT